MQNLGLVKATNDSEPSAWQILHEAQEIEHKWESTMEKALHAKKEAVEAAQRAAGGLPDLQSVYDVSEDIFF